VDGTKKQPASQKNSQVDWRGSSLQYKGAAGVPLEIVKAPVFVGDSVATATNANNAGASIASQVGTAIATIDAGGTLTFPVGTYEEIVLSNGSSYSFTEGTPTDPSLTTYDRSGNGNHITWVNSSAANWALKERKSYPLNSGFSVNPLIIGAALYVDSVSGNDTTGDGSETTPYKTIEKMLSVLDTEETLLLKRGSVFREQFEIPDNIRVEAYGFGAMPIISGAEIVDNSDFSLTATTTNTYEVDIVIAETYNPYVSVTNDDVLMAWEDDVRLGGKFENYQTSIAGVEANPGSHWWDTVTNKLYVHPSDSSNPTTNGKSYEVSVRTLCCHGGDGFYVKGIHAEKCYAKTQTGQQGYALLGYKSGHYDSCVAKHGWNHLVGCNNNEDVNGELLFENIHAEDVEEMSILAGSIYVANKYTGQSFVAKIRFKNCVAKQPNQYSAIQTFGFLSHGVDMDVTFESISAENCYYGIRPNDDTEESVTTTWIGEHSFKNCRFGIQSMNFESVSNVIGISTGPAMLLLSPRAAGSVFTNCKMIDGALIDNAGVTGTMYIKDSVSAFTSVPGSIYGNIAILAAHAGQTVTPTGCTFYNNGCVFYHEVEGSESNNFFGFLRMSLENVTYPPGSFTTLSAWQTGTGQDLLSTQIDPGYDSSFFDVTIPDVVGTQSVGYIPALLSDPSMGADGNTIQYTDKQSMNVDSPHIFSLAYDPNIINMETSEGFNFFFDGSGGRNELTFADLVANYNDVYFYESPNKLVINTESLTGDCLEKTKGYVGIDISGNLIDDLGNVVIADDSSNIIP